MEGAISYQQPQQWEYRPLPQTPFTSLFYTHNISQMKQIWALLCPAPVGRQYSGLKGSRNATAGGKKENTQAQTGLMMLLLTRRRGNPNSSVCGTPPASHDCAWARGSSGELPSHASAWHCKNTPVSPLGKGEKWVWSCKSVPFNPSLHRDIRMCRSRTARIFLLFLKSRGEKKKGIFLPGTPQHSQQSSQIAVAPWDNTLQSRLSSLRAGSWDRKNHQSTKFLGGMDFSQGLLLLVGKTPSSQGRAITRQVRASYLPKGMLSEVLISHSR